MKYNNDIDSIVFPNVTPLNDDLIGLYDFYIPDGRIDAFELKNGTFKFKEEYSKSSKS